ncbi:MAG: DUF4040 domain-containing protein [Nitrospirae bacterium]|nr:DUF4040 domain-containing protein [Candidatus Manganitrophaceae bacterium]
MTSILIIVFFPFAASLLLLLLSPALQKINFGTRLGWAISVVPFTCVALILSLLPGVHAGGASTFHIPWVPRYGIELSFLVDGLSILFGLLISGIGFLVVVYSIWYLSEKEDRLKFYLYLMMFMGAMLGVVFSNNLFGLFTFWELTSVSSFMLIGFWYHKDVSRYGATKALVITGVGGIAMLAGFIVLYSITGTFDISEILLMGDVIRASDFYVPALILIFLGCATKSAQFPFHVWLPNAMEAPTPVSAYLHSATMVKAGIFLVARLSPAFSGTAFWTGLVAGVGLTTMVVGGYMAIRQTDLKGLLAYSTISQLGMIMAMLGFGTQYSAEAAIVHIINHAGFKAALFMIVGIIDHGCGTRDLTYVGGLKKEMPHSFKIALVGCLSMAGLPIFGGFISKEMFYESTLHMPYSGFPYLIPFIAVSASIFTFAYSFKFLIWGFFYDAPKSPPHHPHEAPALGLFSPALLAIIVVLLGIAPGFFAHGVLELAASAVSGKTADLNLALWHGVNTPLIMSFFTVVIGIFLFMRLKKVVSVQDKLSEKVPWLSPNFVYNKGFLEGIPPLTQACMRWFQSGNLKQYLSVIITFVMLSTFGLSISQGNPLTFARLFQTELNFVHLLTFILLIVASLATVCFKNRISAILALGMTGFLVAFFYVLMGAPDLALTQFLVESVAVILILLVFYFLPPYFKEAPPQRTKISDISISVLVGSVMTYYMLMVMDSHLTETIAGYYLEVSEKLAGGRNVVNVVIVDFRGLDTMFEIAVFSIAALGVYGMLKLKKKPKHISKVLGSK